MKLKLFVSALALMGFATGMQAQEDTKVPFDQLRVYINPGHGSWTANDRPQDVIGKSPYSSTNTDTTGFFETNTNLYKGFGVLEKLIEMGMPFDHTRNQTGERWEIGAAKDLTQNLVMSRVKCGPYEETNTTSSPNAQLYNRALFEIACEVEYNDFDIFISIHSNAASKNSVNYHLYMYRGHNGKENVLVPGSWEMAEAASKYSFDNPHAQWSDNSVWIYGDIDFMTSDNTGSFNDLGYYGYLGVMKHGTPGYLVEGYFHTHTPSRHRAMCWDVDIIEGYQYARGVAEYFQFEKREPTGEIYGIVRDSHTKFIHDWWIPVAGTDDVLMPLNGTKVFLWKDGEQIAEYLTDQFYNGAFVFKGLQPGNYQLTFENAQYEPLSKPMDVTVVAGATTYPKAYLTDIYYNGRPGEDINYPIIVPEDVATLADSYELYNGYLDKDIPALAGKTAKRMIWMKGKLYIYAVDADDNPTVLVIDAVSGNVLTSVSTEGCQGGISNLADIAVTADGVLLGCSKSKNQNDDKYVNEGEVRGVVNFYKWANDDNGVPVGAPELWFSTQTAGEIYRAYTGDSFAYSGTLETGKLVVSTTNVASTSAIRNAVFTITNGANDEESFVVSRPTKLAKRDLGDNFRYVISPLDRNQFFVVESGTKYGMREYDINHKNNGVAHDETPSSLGDNTASTGFFKFAGQAMMTNAKANAVELYNITKGIGAPKAITLKYEMAASEASSVLSTGYPIAVTDDEGNIVGGDFSLIVLRDNKLSRYATSEAAGVDNITIDNNDNASVLYYDINGRRVDSPNISKGIYIRVQGSKASKVVVK